MVNIHTIQYRNRWQQKWSDHENLLSAPHKTDNTYKYVIGKLVYRQMYLQVKAEIVSESYTVAKLFCSGDMYSSDFCVGIIVHSRVA